MLAVIFMTAVFSFLTAYYFLVQETKAVKFLRSIPGPKIYPIVGNALQIKNHDVYFDTKLKWCQEYGDRYRILVGHFAYLFVLTGIKDLEKVITSPALLTKGYTYTFLHPWIGDGLLTSKGDKWRHRRKMLTPAFHFKMVELFQQVSDEQSKVLVEIMRNKHEKNEPIHIHHMFSLCALSIICEASLGTKLDCQHESTAYTEAVIKQTFYVFKRYVSPWLHTDFMWSRTKLGKEEKKNLKILHDFINQVIRERKREYLEAKYQTGAMEDGGGNLDWQKKRLAFLDLLIDLQDTSESSLTDEDIYDEAATFTFEGHDTTAAGLTWSVYLLAKHPQYQKQVQEELDSIFGDDVEKPITSADLSKMKFLECCAKEALRLYPSVPTITRSVEQDFQLDEHTIVPAGIDISISPYLIHRKPEYYPEPEKFIPDRHTPENSVGRHPFTFLPFMAGSRNCIGQKVGLAELKIVLANIFRNFTVKLADPNEIVIPLPELIVRPKNDIKVVLELR